MGLLSTLAANGVNLSAVIKSSEASGYHHPLHQQPSVPSNSAFGSPFEALWGRSMSQIHLQTSPCRVALPGPSSPYQLVYVQTLNRD